MTNIALIGPSGVGKGTHATGLAKRLNLLHLVSGDLLRQETEAHSAVGFLAQRQVEQGLLVSDDVVAAVVAAQIWHADPGIDGFLFDGFPRTLDQALFLDRLLAERNQQLDGVIYLDLSDDAILSRLSGRLVCSQCQTPYHATANPPARSGQCDVCGGALKSRDDDIREMISVRLRSFRRAIDPVLAHYQNSDRLQQVDASGGLGEVAEAVDEAVQGLHQRDAHSQTQRIPESTTQNLADHVLPIDTATHASFDLILIGGPGSGKGTQSDALKDHLELLHIASGDLFRDNISNNTDLGKLAKRYMNEGALVPDDVTEAMVEERIGRPDASAGFILDGFPRNLSQANALTDMMNDAGRRVNGAIYIRVSDEEILKRISGRQICRNCQTPFHLTFKPSVDKGICDSCGGELYQRDDDNPRTVGERLKTFHRQNGPILNYYQSLGLLTEIDGEGTVEEVTGRTLSSADRLQSSASSSD